MRDRLERLVLSTPPILVGFLATLMVLAVVVLCIAFIEVAITLFLLMVVGGLSFILGEWIRDSVASDRRYREMVNRRRNVKQD